jgi:pimeloyl-ACP methyl ester carboxylesterase
MQLADIDGITLEYEAQGSGEPIVFIHGAHIGDTYRPLMTESALKNYRLIRYHRRGYAGSSRPDGALSVSAHAADCLALLRKLDAVPARVVGHSSGGVIALQLALDAPEAVRSLTLLEPALLQVPSGAALLEALGPSVQMYEAGNRAGAVDAFLQTVCGKTYRGTADKILPGLSTKRLRTRTHSSRASCLRLGSGRSRRKTPPGSRSRCSRCWAPTATPLLACQSSVRSTSECSAGSRTLSRSYSQELPTYFKSRIPRIWRAGWPPS